jgi:uncharacterized LabA/DUF88 family protein
MANIYVDGESHFIRSEQCFQKLYGDQFYLESAEYPPPRFAGRSYPDGHPPILLIDRQSKFFWDKYYVAFLQDEPLLLSIPDVNKAFYFSSACGDENQLHTIKARIRREWFEPEIVHEPRQLAKQREAQRQAHQVIYKPKGVDIRMATRLLQDAYRQVYDECFLFTSDADFLPVIDAVQQLGKKVYVCGYRQGIGERSPLEYCPDRFIDLTERVRAYRATR